MVAKAEGMADKDFAAYQLHGTRAKWVLLGATTRSGKQIGVLVPPVAAAT